MGPYVYKLIDPRDGAVFYVGKGRNRRAWSHEPAAISGREPNPAKAERILEIVDAGLTVTVQIVSHHDTDEAAGAAEVALIAQIGRESLTNATRGGEIGARLDPEERFRRENDDAIRDTVGLLLSLKPRDRVKDKPMYDFVVDNLRKLLRMEIETLGMDRALSVLRSRGVRVLV